MNVLFSIVAFLLCTSAHAEPVVSVGIGKGAFAGNGTPFERVIAAGWEHRFSTGAFIRPEAGWFMDNSGGGHSSSAWGGALFGVRSKSSIGSELHLAMGPNYLQNPDSVLGGHFQFSLEGGFGIEDKRMGIGVVWKHLSSAGIHMPNRGRDFIVMQVRVPIGAAL